MRAWGVGVKVVTAGTDVDQGAFSIQVGEDMHRMKLMVLFQSIHVPERQ